MAFTAGLIREMLMKRQEGPGGGGPLGPLEWRKVLPFEADALSDELGWVGLEAARYRTSPAYELNHPGITHHRLVLFSRPPEELDLRYVGVSGTRPLPARSPLCRRASRALW